MRSSTLLLYLTCYSLFSFQLDAFEDEFSIRPGALHQAALDVILQERRATPNPGGRGGGVQKDVFAEDSELMKRAKEYAVHRFVTKSDEALKASVRTSPLRQ